MRAAMAEESTPPERNMPRGTSLMRRRQTFCSRRSRQSEIQEESLRTSGWGSGMSQYWEMSGCGEGEDKSSVDRKSTRLNSSHLGISYAVFCLKKKKNKRTSHRLLTLRLDTAGDARSSSESRARSPSATGGSPRALAPIGLFLFFF